MYDYNEMNNVMEFLEKIIPSTKLKKFSFKFAELEEDDISLIKDKYKNVEFCFQEEEESSFEEDQNMQQN